VSLRSSAYAGITAIVLVPGELVTAGPGPLALPAGPSPTDKSWDRPLVGTGNDDPSRHSLAALQWQGTEQLRSITLPGRPVTLDDMPADVSSADDGPSARRPTAGGAFDQGGTGSVPRQRGPLSGPTPSAVADGLTAEGLVQRRRTVPRRTATPAGPGPEAGPSTEDGLPRRIRQASLAPQLRATAPEPEDTQPLRSPEQVRNLMSALQRGTTRGRLVAAGIDPDAPATNFAEAATVTMPVVRDRTEPEGNGADAGHRTTDADGDRDGPQQDDVTRPDKDA
jgi:hypothetical protein